MSSRYLRRLLPLPLHGRHALDFLHATPRAARAVGKTLHTLGGSSSSRRPTRRVMTRTLSHNNVLSVGW